MRTAFIEDLRRALDDLGLTLIEVGRGGYVVFPWSVLLGTAPITAKKYLPDMLTQKDLDVEALKAELEEGQTEDEEDEPQQDSA